MRILMRLGVGVVAGTVSMALVLGTLESEVNWRRMLFIGALCGLGTAATLAALDHKRKLTPIEAVTLQLSRADLSATDAVAIAEHLATLQSLQMGERTGVSRTTHHAPEG
jgi:hypothetical protein